MASFKGLYDVTKNRTEISTLADTLSGFSDIKEAKAALESANIGSEFAKSALEMSKFGAETDGIADAISNLQSASQKSSSIFSGLDNGFKGLLTVIKPIAPALGLAAVALAGFAAFQWLDDKFTLTFDTAQKHAQESANAYALTTSELDNLNSKLSETQTRINELRSKGSLTLIEERELSKLEQQNTLLESQSQFKQIIAQQQASQAAEDTRTALEFKSETVYLTTENGTPLADDSGNPSTIKVDRFDYIDRQIKQMEAAEKSMKDALAKIEADDFDTLSDKKQKQLKEAAEKATKEYENYRSTILSIDSIPDKKITVTADTGGALLKIFSVKTSLASVKDKSVTIRVNRITTESFFSPSGGGQNLNGTAHAYGTAYAYGYWGNRVSGRKLVGELGPEIIVDPYTSRWYTVGNNGPEFTRVPKNAIVFNHLQSASLLKHGYAVGKKLNEIVYREFHQD